MKITGNHSIIFPKTNNIASDYKKEWAFGTKEPTGDTPVPQVVIQRNHLQQEKEEIAYKLPHETYICTKVVRLRK